jgi:transcriptional regulator with XRE-family HTH domain
MKEKLIFDPESIKKRMAAMKPPLTQADVASALDKTVATINMWLNRKHKPHKKDIKALYAYLSKEENGS